MLSTKGTVIIKNFQTRKKPFDAKMHFQRLIGKYNRGKKGPAFIVTSAVNGNKFSGIFAFFNVLGALKQSNILIRREMASLTGLRHRKDEERWRGLRRNRSFENKKTYSGEHIYQYPFQKDKFFRMGTTTSVKEKYGLSPKLWQSMLKRRGGYLSYGI